MRPPPPLDLPTLERQIESWPLPTRRAAFTHAADVAHDGGWRVQVFDSIHDLPVAGWDEIAGPAAAPRSHAYLAAIEASGINDCRYFYPVVYDAAGRVLAQACVYTITTDLTQTLPARWQPVAVAVQRLWPGFLQVKITECASPLVPGHSISIRPGAPRAALIRRLGHVVAELARREGSRLVVFRDFLDTERADADALFDAGYNRASNMPLARIRVRWRTYDEYLDAMRSRYRKDLKRRLERVERGGQRALRLAHFAERAALWAEQVATMYDRSKSFKRERIGARYYEEIERIPAANRMVLAAERDGHPVAHGLVLFDAEHTVATYFGRDAGPPGNEWFHLLNEVIRLGIERGSRYICLGLGSYDAKSLVGADFEPLHCYARSTLAWVNWLMRRVPDRMARPEVRARRIFRDDDAAT
ncbi:MAG: GNAT family N-acetyltransferase [Gammaproteobacteria bacterium]